MGEIKKQGIQNAAIAYTGVVLGFLSILVIQPYFLKPEEIGLIRVLYSFSLLVSTLIPLGIGNATYKFFPQFRSRENGNHGFFRFMLLFPLIGFVITGLLVFILREKIIDLYSDRSALFTEFFNYVLPFSFSLAFISLLTIYCSSLFKSSFPTFLSDIVTKLFPVIIISLYYLKWISLSRFVFLYVLCFGLVFLILLIYVFVIDKPWVAIDKSKFTGNKIKEITVYSLSFSFASLASLGMKYLDTTLIGIYVPLALAGIYGTVIFIPVVIEIPLQALDKIAGAKISDALTHNRMKEIQYIYYRASKYLFLAGGLLFLGININIHKLLWLLPQDYWRGEWVVHIVSIGTLFNMATSVNNSIIYFSSYYRYGLAFLALLIITSFVNYLIFIPLWGMEGAAFATVLSSVLFNFLKFFFIWRKMGLQPFDAGSLKTLLLIAACGLLWFVNIDLGSATLEIAVMSVLITLLYLTGAYYLKIVPEIFSSRNFNEIKKRIGF